MVKLKPKKNVEVVTKISKDEIDDTLNKIFDSVTAAIQENEEKRLSLEVIDKTLYALFEAVNRVRAEGKNMELPDFRKILQDTK